LPGKKRGSGTAHPVGGGKGCPPAEEKKKIPSSQEIGKRRKGPSPHPPPGKRKKTHQLIILNKRRCEGREIAGKEGGGENKLSSLQS